MSSEEYLYSIAFYRNNKKIKGISTVEGNLLDLILSVFRDVGRFILYHDKIEMKIEKVIKNEENEN